MRNTVMYKKNVPLSSLEVIASSAVKTCIDMGAKMIVVLTESGNTARLIAKYRLCRSDTSARGPPARRVPVGRRPPGRHGALDGRHARHSLDTDARSRVRQVVRLGRRGRLASSLCTGRLKRSRDRLT